MAETCVRVRVGTEQYAFPVRHVPEVAEMGDITPVPGAPPQVMGIRNLRGEVLAVFDLAAGLGAQGSGSPERIILADVDGRRCALAVDEVLEVAELGEPEEAVESPFLLGAVLLDGRLVGLVDVPALLQAIAPAESR
ncbi:MAG: chemotaxis protein CheW [Solirubrobacteraceae bacterium]